MLATLRQRNFALLWTAGLVSVAGDAALLTALPLHAYALTGSALAAGAVFAAALPPRVALGSFAGVFVDRWDRRRTMVVADLLRAAALLPLLAAGAADRLWLLYLVRLATGTLALFFTPAESALLPRLVGEDRLVAANALNALNDNLGRLAGPALGGVLYAAGGLGAVVVVDAASFVVSAGCIAAIHGTSRPERSATTGTPTSASRRVLDEWRAGVRLIRGDRALGTVFLAFGIGLLGEGTFEVGIVPLAVTVLGGGAEGLGLLLSAQALGGIAAGAGIARASAAVAPRLLFGGGLIGIGLVDLGLANAARLTPPGASPLVLASGFMVLAGFPAVAGFAAGHGLLQALTPDAFRGRVFGALEAVSGVATVLGLSLGGLATERVGVVPVLSMGALTWIAGGVVALVRRSPTPGAPPAGARRPANA